MVLELEGAICALDRKTADYTVFCIGSPYYIHLASELFHVELEVAPKKLVCLCVRAIF